MEYQALYRKYRPQRFADLVGQDHITLTLAREVQNDQVAHAYLFAGPRGTGKTSTARIIAKSLNCEDLGVDGEPCNACISCAAITEGTSLDVIELDAASHNKVEDVREIRANVGTVASAGGARRVYILDEAHMLSRAAANALLKTLEEPPEHAHFVLATTEPYKLPDTIRSRTQRFDFHPVGSEALIEHTGRIAAKEGFEANPEALALIARHARGSVRDALGLLEQVAALGAGKVESRGVTRALGLAPSETFTRLVDVVADSDAPGALALVASVAAEGADLRRFVTDSIEFFRGVFLAMYAPNLEEIVDEPADVLEEWRRHASRLEVGDVLRAVDLLADALVSLREGREERLVIELTLMRLARPEIATDPVSLSTRLDRLEQRVRWLGESAAQTGADRSTTPVPPGALPRAEPEPPRAPAPTEPEPAEDAAAPVPVEEAGAAAAAPEATVPVAAGEFDLSTVDGIWPALMARVRDEAGPRRHALFQVCRPGAVEGSKLILEVPGDHEFHLQQLSTDNRLAAVIVAVAGDLLGGAVQVEFRRGSGSMEPLPVVESEPMHRAPDKDQLEDSSDGPIDPTSVVLEEFGGRVVEE